MPGIIRTATLGWLSNNTFRADQTLFHAFRRISVVFRIGIVRFFKDQDLGIQFVGSSGLVFSVFNESVGFN